MRWPTCQILSFEQTRRHFGEVEPVLERDLSTATDFLDSSVGYP